MLSISRAGLLVALLVTVATLGACGDDDDGGPGGTEADQHGIGAVCAGNEDCWETGQSCLPFKGGYCGVEGCAADADCPSGARCVTHDDGKNYCFLVCTDKPQCNLNRPLEYEANCSSNITFAGGSKNGKACVPPS